MSIMQHVPIIRSVYGFIKVSVRIYNATLPVNAVCEEPKTILIDCSPLMIKYLFLCAYLLGLGYVSVCSSENPLAITGTINAGRMIMEEL